MRNPATTILSLVEFRELLGQWTAQLLKEAGADCIKLLLYYNPFEDDQVNVQKKTLVERIGAECGQNDIPFFLEFVGYDLSDTGDPLDYARRKPEIVKESMREFSRDIYQVDVLKVEIPVRSEIHVWHPCLRRHGSGIF